MKRSIVFLMLIVLLCCTACGSNEIILDEEPILDPTPTPEVTSDPQLVKTVESLFAQQLDFAVPDDEADASAKVSNAMLKATKVIVHSALDHQCEVTICYPDVATLLYEAVNTLPEEASEEEWDALFNELTSKIENKEATMVEESFSVTLQTIDEEVELVFTNELMNALSGGLYLVEGEE